MLNAYYQVWRRVAWLMDNFLTARKVFNYLRLGVAYLLKRERIGAWPAVLKIDISPMCNLQCPVCVHADVEARPELAGQAFKNKYMSVEDFTRIVTEASGRVSAVSLYYLGDPFMHPDIDELCSIASRAGLNVHLSSNFSFKFSDERIAKIARSGVTHLTACVDGFSQENYSQTRVGGKIAYVLSNIERILRYRREQGLRFPKVEVQFIKFLHNAHELARAEAWCREVGVDQIESYWGMVNNYADLEPSRFTVKAALPAGKLPRCYWPFATMTIKWNGDVIPCCNFRHATQYVEGSDAKVLGNVLTDGFRSVWDSRPYHESRRLCSDPSAAGRDPALKQHFCYSCPALYASDYEKNVKLAPVYFVDGRRKADTPTPAGV